MGHRLTKIYTRTGDKGDTALGTGARVDKDDSRVEAFGTVDELNSLIGVVLSEEMPGEIRDLLTDIQHDLFELGGDLSVPGRASMTPAHTDRLEQALDTLNTDLPWLKEFILPGGNRAAALCHLARTVCRRAERHCVTLNREHPLPEAVLSYLNRLSDLLFVMARYLNHSMGDQEVLWEPGRKRDS